MGEPITEGSLTGQRRYVEAVGGELILQVQYNSWSSTLGRWRPFWRYARKDDVPETLIGLPHS